jgi:two-component system, NtrC family, C4-dicarboxylate transport sensor histidine kinase DctB
VQERTAELRALQNDLIHAGKLAALGQMSAGVVHELNQPLAAMRTLSDNAAVLLHKGRLDEANDNLQRIASLTDRLGRMTQQLKVFAHKSSLPSQRVGVRKAVQEALPIVAARVREINAVVSVQIDPEDLGVMAEDVRLEQVLVNLMGNAVDAMAGVDTGAGERRLGIHASRRGDCAVIRISDTGPGIRADVLPQLFEPFVTTKSAGKGLGLGLMISAHIVREFGGRLLASNRLPSLGKTGAEFVIELPLTASDTGPSA